MSCVQCGGKTSGWDFCDRCEEAVRMHQRQAAEEREAMAAEEERLYAEEMGRLEAASRAAEIEAGATQPDPATAGEKPDQDQTPETGPEGAQT